MQSFWLVPVSFIVGANFGFFAPQGHVFRDADTMVQDVENCTDEADERTPQFGTDVSLVTQLTLRQSMLDLSYDMALFATESIIADVWSVETASMFPDNTTDIWTTTFMNSSKASLNILPAGVSVFFDDLAASFHNTSEWQSISEHAKSLVIRFNARFPKYVLDVDQPVGTVCSLLGLCILSLCEVYGMWKLFRCIARYIKPCPCRKRRWIKSCEERFFMIRWSDGAQCKLNFKGGQKVEFSHAEMKQEGTLLDTRIRFEKDAVSISQARTSWARFLNCLQL